MVLYDLRHEIDSPLHIRGPRRSRPMRPHAATRSLSLLVSPLPEGQRPDAELMEQSMDIGVVAHAVEPLQHERVVLALPSHFIDGHRDELDPPSQGAAEDLRRLGHRPFVAGDIDRAAVQRLVPLEGEAPEPADVLHGDHLEPGLRLQGDRELPSSSPGLNQGEVQFSMKKTGLRIT